MFAALGAPESEVGSARSRPIRGCVLLVVLSCLVLPGPNLLASPDREEVAGHCPYGHEALVKVRIDERGRSFQDSPRFNIVCQQCGARDSRLRAGDEWVRDPNWVRDSIAPESFELPLAELIRGFPVVSPVGGSSPNYRQHFVRGTLWNESLFYSSSADFEELALAILDYLDDLATPYRITTEFATGFTLSLEDAGHRTSVTTSCRVEHCQVAASRIWQPRESRARPVAGRARARNVTPEAIPAPRGRPADPRRSPPPPPVVVEEPIDLANLPEGLSDAGFRRPEKVSAQTPRYNEEARKARIQGAVSARLHISRGGDVLSVEILEGLPLLDEEAAKAFSRWKFKPATVRGEAVETYWYGSVNFRLQ